MRLRAGALIAAALAVWIAVAGGGTATAAGLEIKSFETSLSTSLAGAHPDLRTAIELKVDGESQPIGGTVKDLSFGLPEGLVGAANATPTCSINRVLDFENPCPLDTAVGKVVASVIAPPSTSPSTYKALIYNVTPLPGEPAAFAFDTIFPVRLDVSVRSGGDYGMTVTASDLTEGAHVIAADLTLWGVPADDNGPGPETELYGRSFGGPGDGERRPLLTNPTDCSGGALPTKVAIDSWQNPGVFVSQAYYLPPVVGCDELAFAPGLGLDPGTRAAGTPSGFDVDLTSPQGPDPAARAPADLREATIELPEGVVLSAASTGGLGGCTDAQLQAATEGEPGCPDASKAGTAELSTPLLDSPLRGSVYVGSQLSADPTSGRMVRLFIVVSGAGVTVKLVGGVRVDPLTGRLTIHLADLPQLPFEVIHLRFHPGSRALLATPVSCGTYTTAAELLPWSGGDAAEARSSFAVDQGCDRGTRFSPGLEAGALRPAAGAPSPFVIAIADGGGGDNLSRVEVTLPQGVTAAPAGIPLCGEGEATAGTCPAASRIGMAAVAIGPGATPLDLPEAGDPSAGVYLASPYAGAPYSAFIELPARAGPFDLGVVSVRSALAVDPESGRVTLRSDPLPQILRGVPISYRSIQLRIDHPGFMFNPTDCRAMKVGSRLISAAGAIASPRQRFQVAGCRSLSFRPRLSLRFGGGHVRSAHPRLDATLRLRNSGANLAAATLTLPSTEFLALPHVRRICSTAQFEARACPRGSVYGRAAVWTPLLEKPLKGPVYLRTSRRRFPDLVASLDGAVHMDLVGRIGTVGSRIRVSYPHPPDLPVSKVVLELQGGRRGLLVNNVDICRSRLAAAVALRAQNGLRRLEGVEAARAC